MTQQDSYVFTVRLWRETGEDGKSEWHGRIQRVPQGPTRYFRGRVVLTDHLLSLLSDDVKPSSEDAEPEERVQGSIASDNQQPKGGAS